SEVATPPATSGRSSAVGFFSSLSVLDPDVIVVPLASVVFEPPSFLTRFLKTTCTGRPPSRSRAQHAHLLEKSGRDFLGLLVTVDLPGDRETLRGDSRGARRIAERVRQAAGERRGVLRVLHDPQVLPVDQLV